MADFDSVAQSLSRARSLLESQDEAPIIRLINALVRAVKENVDIHIEPLKTRLSIPPAGPMGSQNPGAPGLAPS